MRRLDCHTRIKQVKDDYHVVYRALSTFVRIATQQPHMLHDNDPPMEKITALIDDLRNVYIVRMFARFESDLRHYWRTRVRDTKPKTEQLLSSIAGRFGVPQDTLDVVHGIRKFRNFLIHEEEEESERFTIDDASGSLNTYLARLPLEW